MGAVFTSAARAPLTSLASVVEMTGDFSLTLPVMLAVAVASTVSRTLSYGTIYTTKLLRRGTDIDRAAPWRALADLKVTDAMHPFGVPLPADGDGSSAEAGRPDLAGVAGPVTRQPSTQAVFAGESLGQALRQLEVYGRDGLPVISGDGRHIKGWVTNASVLRALARQLSTARVETAHAQLAADWGHENVASSLREPPAPLHGYQVAEVTIAAGSPAAGRRLAEVDWPPACTAVTVLQAGRLRPASPSIVLRTGDRVSLLVPVGGGPGPVKGGARPSAGCRAPGLPGSARADAGAGPDPEDDQAADGPGQTERQVPPQGRCRLVTRRRRTGPSQRQGTTPAPACLACATW
jgi:CIC family chloride channel protein